MNLDEAAGSQSQEEDVDDEEGGEGSAVRGAAGSCGL